MPAISVIVPVYNVEKYIRRCVDSILAQTFADFELILVDDGSPDNCPAICDEYSQKDGRVKVIHKKNEGVAIARNVGLDLAVGEYITFVDSDDFIGTERLAMLYRRITKEQADVVVTDFAIMDESGQIVKYIKHRNIGSTDIKTNEDRKRHLFCQLLTCAHGWEIWTRLFRGEIIRAHHIRFPDTCENYAEDLGFVMAYMLYARRFVSLEDADYFYTLRTRSMMRSSQGKVKLNQLNEISKWTYPRYCAAMGDESGFPILHFLLMNTEYGKIRENTERYSRLSDYLETIQDQNWYAGQTAGIRKCNASLDACFGKRARQQIGLFSHYCRHRNWKRYAYESAFAYRFIIAKE